MNSPNPTSLALAGGVIAALATAAGAQQDTAESASQTPAGVDAQTEPSGRADTPLFERDRVTGDWWGARSALEEIGLSFGGEYIAEFNSVFDGGLNETGSFRNLLLIDATLDLEAAFDIPGGSVFVQYLSVNPEEGGSLDAGDIQVYSNIENDIHLDVIFELWYEQLLFGDRLRVKFGKLDANSEFAYVDVAGEFSNSSAGFSPTIFPFPSYPNSATSLNVFATVLDKPGWSLTLGYGFYDGAAGADGLPTGSQGPASFFSSDRSDDYFHIWQADLRWDGLRSEGPWLKDGRLSAGAWLHTGEFARFDGGTEDDPAGLYLTAEQRLYATDDEDGGLYAFAQYAWADEEVSEFAQHAAGGFVLRGTLPGRRDDSAGVYLSYVDLSDDPLAGFDKDEFVVDAYYKVQLTPAVFVQPEIQYIVNPSGSSAVDDAIVGGLRVSVTF